MDEPTRPTISDAERESLKVLWDEGPSTVRAVQEVLTRLGWDWSRSTVITLLQRLEKKGYVRSDRSQFAFVFHPLVTREQMMHARMTEIAGELCGGEALPLVMAFAQQHSFSASEIDQFRRMIESLLPCPPSEDPAAGSTASRRPRSQP